MMQRDKVNKHLVLVSLALFTCSFACAQRIAGDRILGRWISEKKNLIVEIDREGDAYRGKIIWFSDKDNPRYPMKDRVDLNNPEESLRNRKLIGLNVLKSLTYQETTNSWENGLIYDARSGKEWSSCVKLINNEELFVKGYWHFKFIGKTTTFRRINYEARIKKPGDD